MRFPGGLIACVAGVCISGSVAIAAPPAAPETFTVNLSPPEKVGDRYHLISRATETKDEIIARVHGKNEAKEDVTVDLDGIVTVRKIDSHGSATWLECTVTHLRATEGGITSDIIPPGSVITTQAVPLSGDRYQRYIKWQGGKLGPDRIKQLGKVFQSAMPEAPTQQDIFGSATPQPIGSTWALNRERGVQYLSSLAITVEPRDFSGKSQLIGIEKLGNVDSFHVDGSMKATKFKLTVTSNAKTDKASMWLKFSAVVPRDLSLRSKYSEQGHIELTERGVDANVQGFRRELTMDYTQEMTVEPVK